MNSKQAGMSTEAKLLYQISKQLDRLIKINAATKNQLQPQLPLQQ
jgi:hypothetical protein